MGDVIDSTLMHINKGNVHRTQRERTNGDNSDPGILLMAGVMNAVRAREVHGEEIVLRVRNCPLF